MMGVFIQGICGIVGDQGSGKGFAMNKIGLLYADQIEYDLCFNYEIDERALFNYCLEMGYTWLMSRIIHNKIRVKSSENLMSFMDAPKTIYILDEAGVYLNSRRFRDIDPNFLHEIAQVRHDSKLLWWVAQYPDMVDKMLRSLTASFIQVDGKQRFSKKLGNSELIWQRIYLFNARNFKIYLQKVHEKMTGLKYWINARRLADFHWEGVLDSSDKLIFDIYQSFGYRVGDQNENKPRRSFKNLRHKVTFLVYDPDQVVPDLLGCSQFNKLVIFNLILCFDNPKLLLHLIILISSFQAFKLSEVIYHDQDQFSAVSSTNVIDYSFLF